MDEPQNRLELDSRLDDLGRVSSWVNAIADRYGVGEQLRFALHLCLEEALANVVLHGYKSEPGHRIVINSWRSGDALFFAIEDDAPPFAPPATDPSEKEAVNLDTVETGGNGIRLLRHFAGSLTYERTAKGNRLTIGFLAASTS